MIGSDWRNPRDSGSVALEICAPAPRDGGEMVGAQAVGLRRAGPGQAWCGEEAESDRPEPSQRVSGVRRLG